MNFIRLAGIALLLPVSAAWMVMLKKKPLDIDACMSWETH